MKVLLVRLLAVVLILPVRYMHSRQRVLTSKCGTILMPPSPSTTNFPGMETISVFFNIANPGTELKKNSRKQFQ